MRRTSPGVALPHAELAVGARDVAQHDVVHLARGRGLTLGIELAPRRDIQQAAAGERDIFQDNVFVVLWGAGVGEEEADKERRSLCLHVSA